MDDLLHRLNNKTRSDKFRRTLIEHIKDNLNVVKDVQQKKLFQCNFYPERIQNHILNVENLQILWRYKRYSGRSYNIS